MDEATTTEEVVEAPAEATEETQETSQAEETTTETAEAEETQEETQPPAPNEDLDWLRRKANIDPDDPEALHKAAQLWRKADRDFHDESQAKAKNATLEETTNEVVDQAVSDPSEARMLKLELRQGIRDFTDTLRNKGMSGDDIETVHAKMADVIRNDPGMAQRLPAAYAMVREADHQAELKAAEQRGWEKARQSIAKQSVAGNPKGNASTQTEEPTEQDKLAEIWK